jgi:hypothetical protein
LNWLGAPAHMLELRRNVGARRGAAGRVLLALGVMGLLASASLWYLAARQLDSVNRELETIADRQREVTVASQEATARSAALESTRIQNAKPWIEAPWGRLFGAVERYRPSGGWITALEADAESGSFSMTVVVRDVSDGVEAAVRLGRSSGLSEVVVISHSRRAGTDTSTPSLGPTGSVAALGESQVVLRGRWTSPAVMPTAGTRGSPGAAGSPGETDATRSSR